MTDWFRSWHGAPTNPKWRTVARRAGVRPGDVVAVVWVLMDRASQATPRGSIAGYDVEVIADALGYEPDDVTRIIAALRDKEALSGDDFAGWSKYQPAREDGAAERAKAWRERNRTQVNAGEPERTLDKSRVEQKENAPNKKGAFLSAAKTNETASEGVFVIQGTPAWHAWTAVKGCELIVTHHRVGGQLEAGQWCRSEYPPELQAVRVA